MNINQLKVKGTVIGEINGFPRGNYISFGEFQTPYCKNILIGETEKEAYIVPISMIKCTSKIKQIITI